jgi:hypothetical protein
MRQAGLRAQAESRADWVASRDPRLQIVQICAQRGSCRHTPAGTQIGRVGARSPGTSRSLSVMRFVSWRGIRPVMDGPGLR